MQYLYGEFSDEQITETIAAMHNEIHKLLLHKDKKITELEYNFENILLVHETVIKKIKEVYK